MALGILAAMSHKDGRVHRMVPVEYNQIEAALRTHSDPHPSQHKGGAPNGRAAGAAHGSSAADVNGPDGYSAYIGNTNAFFVQLPTYLRTLAATGGAVRLHGPNPSRRHAINPHPRHPPEARRPPKHTLAIRQLASRLPNMAGA